MRILKNNYIFLQFNNHSKCILHLGVGILFLKLYCDKNPRKRLSEYFLYLIIKKKVPEKLFLFFGQWKISSGYAENKKILFLQGLTFLTI